jgi:DNA-directed RNA polymerase subunit M/transcription elongation factor TFIIS
MEIIPQQIELPYYEKVVSFIYDTNGHKKLIFNDNDYIEIVYCIDSLSPYKENVCLYRLDRIAVGKSWELQELKHYQRKDGHCYSCGSLEYDKLYSHGKEREVLVCRCRVCNYRWTQDLVGA